jgi:two-component system phosphate regulon sensor histidine kinase PhoR
LRLGIRSKLFLTAFGLIAVTFATAFLFLRVRLESNARQQFETDLTIRARVASVGAERDFKDLGDSLAWTRLAGELAERAQARVTLISREGQVWGDSSVAPADLSHLDNHSARPEVVQAIATGQGHNYRYSATLGKTLLYVAVPLKSGGTVVGVCRLAVEPRQVDQVLSELSRMELVASGLGLGIALALALVAAQLSSQRARSLTDAAQRMAAGDLRTRTRSRGDDEFAQLGRALDALAEGLSRSLDEVKGQHDRLDGILRSMQEGVLTLDADGRIAVVNPALREMLLLDSQSEGRRPLEVIRHAELKELLDRVKDSGAPSSAEIEVGGLKPRRLLVRVAPLAQPDAGLFAVFVDVTEMRRLETLRRDFVANVSHELRTPVTAIQSAAETLRHTTVEDPAASAQFIEMIGRQSSRLAALVEDLLDLSRIESRELKLQPERLELGDQLRSVAGLLAARAEQRQVTFEFSATEGGVWAMIDRKAFEHIVTNLVENALKYAGLGARVTLSASAFAQHATVTVADNGPGIEARHLPRIFERFYRVDPGRSRDMGGTGLGLAIVKHLVEAMGGQVSVSSEVGAGTQFSFTVPLQRGLR